MIIRGRRELTEILRNERLEPNKEMMKRRKIIETREKKIK